MATYVIGAVILGAVVFAGKSVLKAQKHGGCVGCSSCDKCHSGGCKK